MAEPVDLRAWADRHRATASHPADCSCCTPTDPLDAPIGAEAQSALGGIVAGLLFSLVLFGVLDLLTGHDVLATMLGLR